MKRFLKRFRYGQKGFTLIELLVVVAILGIIAAVAVPNVASFIGRGTAEAARTELHNVQLAVTSAMADQSVGTIAGTPPFTLDENNNVTVGSTNVGAFVIGGVANIQGIYSVAADGSITQVSYPGL